MEFEAHAQQKQTTNRLSQQQTSASHSGKFTLVLTLVEQTSQQGWLMNNSLWLVAYAVVVVIGRLEKMWGGYNFQRNVRRQC